MRDYDFYKKIEDDSNIAAMFNKAMKKTLPLRISCAPKSFQEMREHQEHVVVHFYEMCLCEMWMHRVVEMLREWDRLIEEYFNEFSGSWKFYALTKRIDSIKECGGEDDDYTEDGAIKNVFPDDKLIPYSIIKKLIPDDFKDIVFDSNINDLMVIPGIITVASQIHFEDFIKETYGKELNIYKQGDDGEMIPMSKMEKSLDKIGREAEGEDLALLIKGIISTLYTTILLVKTGLSATEDNKYQIQRLHSLVKGMLNLEDWFIDSIRETNRNNQ